MKKPFWIHQIWWPFNEKAPQSAFEKYKVNIESWRKYHRYHLIWNKQQCHRLLSYRYPWFLNHWLSYPSEVQRCDSIRPFILHSFGGVYADMDTICYKSFSDLIEQGPLIFANELGINEFVHDRLKISVLQNAIMIARSPGHDFWLHFAKCMLLSSPFSTDVVHSTGPYALTKAYRSFNDPLEFLIVPRQYFFPIPHYLVYCPSYQKSRYTKEQIEDVNFGLLFYPEAYASHQYHASWSQDVPTQKKSVKFIGKNIFFMIMIILLCLIFMKFHSKIKLQ